MPASEEQFQWQEELNKDGSKRLPIMFCLDTSGSMRKCLKGGKKTGERVYDEDSGTMCWEVTGGIRALDELNKAMKHFFYCIRSNMYALSAAEIAIITFDDVPHVIRDFCRVRVSDEDILSEFKVGVYTHMGEGLQMALDMMQHCLDRYRKNGIDYDAPWLIIINDGFGNGNNYEYEDAKRRIAYLNKNENLTVFSIGVGERQNNKCLSEIAMGRTPSDIYGIDYQKLFTKMAEAAAVAGESVEEMEVEKIIDGEMEQNEFYETRELNACAEQIDLEIVYNI